MTAAASWPSASCARPAPVSRDSWTRASARIGRGRIWSACAAPWPRSSRTAVRSAPTPSKCPARCRPRRTKRWATCRPACSRRKRRWRRCATRSWPAHDPDGVAARAAAFGIRVPDLTLLGAGHRRPTGGAARVGRDQAGGRGLGHAARSSARALRRRPAWRRHVHAPRPGDAGDGRRHAAREPVRQRSPGAGGLARCGGPHARERRARHRGLPAPRGAGTAARTAARRAGAVRGGRQVDRHVVHRHRRPHAGRPALGRPARAARPRAGGRHWAAC